MITIILKFIFKCVADPCFDRRNLSDDINKYKCGRAKVHRFKSRMA